MDFLPDFTSSSVEGVKSVQREVALFFRDHPFILVSENRLAVLLCRPLDMVSEAVGRLEAEGLLARRDNETLLCVSDRTVELEVEV